MSPHRSRFVTACQQLLALGVVVAALTPAAQLVSLDVTHEPSTAQPQAGATAGAAYRQVAAQASQVPVGPVETEVHEYPLTAPADARLAPAALQASTRRVAGAEVVTSSPQPTEGQTTVGLTWGGADVVGHDDIAAQVRTLDEDGWSSWSELEYHDEHGPDPDSVEGRAARPGTEPVYVGEVEQVQVRATVQGAAPGDLRLAVVEAGQAEQTASERGAIEIDPSGDAVETADPAEEEGEGDLALQAGTATVRPVIYSREQWGADESMRSGSPSYHEVHAGFVHHTVNANDYSRADVPGILRGIYSYHTRSRGWSDVGYNFLVDKFGRIWEGRAGGVDRPVVGAHTLGYNEYSFAMSAVGNFESARPSEAVVEAYGALFAWKLSLHGVDATSTAQAVGSRTFAAINGHRDAGSTACPGRYLYDRLGDIRRLAGAAQAGWSGRELDADLVGSRFPDLVARRADDGRLVLIPTEGLSRVRKPQAVGTGWSSYDDVLVSPDLTGDGRADVLGVAADGSVDVHEVAADGSVGDTVRTLTGTRDHDLHTPVGDVDGDGRADLVARNQVGRLVIFRGNEKGGIRAQGRRTVVSDYDLLAGPGDLDGDGQVDLVARDTDGVLWRLPGTPTGFGEPVRLAVDAGSWDVLSALGDWNDDGHADLLVRREGGHGFVLPGRGDGTFGHLLGAVKRLKGRPALTGAGGSVAGNDAPDVLARRGDTLIVLRGQGTYETGAPVDTGIKAGNLTAVLNAGDWDGDGHGDLVVRNRKGVLKLRLGDGAGGFGKGMRIGNGFKSVSLLEAVGDMTGDGLPDLMGRTSGGSMKLYPGRGTKKLQGGYTAKGSVSGVRQMGTGRWDDDGAPDALVRRGDDLLLYPGNGPGGLRDAVEVSTDLAAYDLVTGIGAVNLKGRPDLVVREKRTGRLLLLEGRARSLASPRFLMEGAEVYDLLD